MTIDQTEFVLLVQRTFDRCFDEGDVSDSFFGQIFRAAAHDDDIEIARLTAEMVVHLALVGNDVEPLAKIWMHHFGAMFPTETRVPLTANELFP